MNKETICGIIAWAVIAAAVIAVIYFAISYPIL